MTAARTTNSRIVGSRCEASSVGAAAVATGAVGAVGAGGGDGVGAGGSRSMGGWPLIRTPLGTAIVGARSVPGPRHARVSCARPRPRRARRVGDSRPARCRCPHMRPEDSMAWQMIGSRRTFVPPFVNERFDGPPFWACTYTALLNGANVGYLGRLPATHAEVAKLAGASGDRDLKSGSRSSHMISALRRRYKITNKRIEGVGPKEA